MTFSTEWKVIKFMFQTTNQSMYILRKYREKFRKTYWDMRENYVTIFFCGGVIVPQSLGSPVWATDTKNTVIFTVRNHVLSVLLWLLYCQRNHMTSYDIIWLWITNLVTWGSKHCFSVWWSFHPDFPRAFRDFHPSDQRDSETDIRWFNVILPCHYHSQTESGSLWQKKTACWTFDRFFYH